MSPNHAWVHFPNHRHSFAHWPPFIHSRNPVDAIDTHERNSYSA